MNEQWMLRALYHVAKARGLGFPVTDEDFDRVMDLMTADDALYVAWVATNQKIPTGCLVRTCENGDCANPAHAEERPPTMKEEAPAESD